MPTASTQLLPALSQTRLFALCSPANTWYSYRVHNKFWPAAPRRSILTRTVNISRIAPTSQFYSTGAVAGSTMTSQFRLSDYDCIGFDLDHTLARYRLDNLYPLIYTTLCRFLVERKGYDARLLEPLGDGRDFLTKGLLVDARRGNLLKVGKTGAVLRASHGTRRMTDLEIVSVYGPDRQWQPLQAFQRTMCEGHGKPAQAMRAFKDYFDIPAALASARIVDLIDQSTNKLANEDDFIQPEDYEYDFLKDIRLGLIDMYRSEAFALGTGGYFSTIRENPSRYLVPCDDATKRWLRELRAAGKFVYMLTGSAHDYGSLLAEFCLGPDWRDYFDVVVTMARKPGFFTGQRPFQSVGNVSEAVRIQRGDLVAQGNYGELLALAETVLGKNDPRSLYVGDNLIQDVFTPAKFARCHAVAVVEEMEAEGMVGPHETHPAGGLLSSKRWGSFFCDGESGLEGVGRVDTLWGELVVTQSQLAVPSVASLANVPIEKPLAKFNAADPAGPSGFFPGDPTSLHPAK